MIASLVSLLLSLVSPVVLEWMKKSPWLPFITANTKTLNRLVAVAIAVGQTIGISFAFDATAGTLTIAGLVLSDMARIGWTALLAFVTQELAYRGLVRK
jgi:hypothetical protein